MDKALVIIIIASLFHKSSLIGLALLAYMYFKQVKYIYYFSAVLFLVLLFYSQPIALLLVGANEMYEHT